MRHKYGYNSQVGQFGSFNALVPLGYIDCCPGESLSGSINVDLRSAPTLVAIDTRNYIDVYAFYVPYRVLDQRFPGFVMQPQGGSWFAYAGSSLTWPNVAITAAPFNFEDRLVCSSTGASFDYNMPWNRLAYNAIYNRFFRDYNTAVATTEPVGVYSAYQRPSTLEKRTLRGNAETYDTQVPLAGTSPNQTVSLNQLRSSMSQDRFAKMRYWYGDKYVDYMAALGVSLDWSLLEEPEIIAQCHHPLNYKDTPQTAPTATGAPNNVVGQVAGQFRAKVRMPLKRTFIPEHGVIAVMSVCRAEPLWGQPPMPVNLGKQNPASYWSPEYEGLIGNAPSGAASGAAFAGQLSARVFVPVAAVANQFDWHFPIYEEYRTGQNYNRAMPTPSVYPVYGMYSTITSTSDDKYLNIQGSTYAANNFTQSFGEQYQLITTYQLQRRSPVRLVDVKNSPKLV